MLESYKHAQNAFVTLTYNDEHLPEGGTLVKADYQNFLKRLRERIQAPLRFYVAGEYGENGGRPHYHFALFGVGPQDSQQIDASWGLGFSHIGDLTHDSAQYCAGYVTKKMTHPESKCTDKCTHPPLNGRLPEFSKMSLKPGIGAPSIPDIADVLTSPHGCDTMALVGDVPHALILENKQLPLGRYLRRKLREKLGFPENGKTPLASLDAWNAQMQELHKDYKESESAKAISRYVDKTQHYKQWLVDKNSQKVLQLEKRNKLFSAKKDKL